MESPETWLHIRGIGNEITASNHIYVQKSAPIISYFNDTILSCYINRSNAMLTEIEL